MKHTHFILFVTSLALLPSLSRAGSNDFKRIQSMTEPSLEHAAKVQSTTHRLYAGQGYTYRVQCGWIKNVTKCVENTLKELADYYSQPDHVQVSDQILKADLEDQDQIKSEMDRIKKSLTHHKSGGTAGPLTQKEIHSLVAMQSAIIDIMFHAKTGKALTLYTGSEGNGFGGSTFVLVHDAANNELLMMGNGYAE